MFLTLLFYAIKATFRLAILAIKYQIHGAESKKTLVNKFKKNVDKIVFRLEEVMPYLHMEQ